MKYISTKLNLLMLLAFTILAFSFSVQAQSLSGVVTFRGVILPPQKSIKIPDTAHLNKTQIMEIPKVITFNSKHMSLHKVSVNARTTNFVVSYQ